MTALTPALFVTRVGVPALLRVGEGFDDDGVAYDLLARTRRTAPAGPEGEAVFYVLSVVTTHYDANASLFVVAYIDGVAAGPAQRLDLVAGPASGTTTTHEIGLSVPYYDAAVVEQYRAAPRGTWIEVEVYTEQILFGGARQVAAQVSVEWEAVRESRPAVGV